MTGDERVGLNIIIRAIEEPLRWQASGALVIRTHVPATIVLVRI